MRSANRTLPPAEDGTAFIGQSVRTPQVLDVQQDSASWSMLCLQERSYGEVQPFLIMIPSGGRLNMLRSRVSEDWGLSAYSTKYICRTRLAPWTIGAG